MKSKQRLPRYAVYEFCDHPTLDLPLKGATLSIDSRGGVYLKAAGRVKPISPTEAMSFLAQAYTELDENQDFTMFPYYQAKFFAIIRDALEKAGAK